MNTQLLTLNIQGQCSLENRQSLIWWLNCFQPTKVCLQETHSILEEELSDWFSCINPTTHNTNYKCIVYHRPMYCNYKCTVYHRWLAVGKTTLVG